MGNFIGLIALVVLLGCVAGVVVWLVEREDRTERRDAQESAASRRAAEWEVAQEGGRGAGGAGGVVRVFLRRTDSGGKEIERIAVAEIPSNATDWDDRVLAARSMAATRAALLNAEP